ncbi:sigma-70 family RNA polymerase sigma factor [Glycomyces algeriensis]|uniref:RNA polymerase sigma24 factor n=1 Tax=Glycomyces algeriensis TaxID=256037 RepID=A0A9W6GAS5_9ACTN|nr:sigma-70 family RNA polymerase sigma factor [Glycomyces algeriensis]MDA1367432.1 sigma-70 family RNA polymerase sigma factor [Glycomyces algeriensis]MDR7350914.1 RNA polymerase sigma-70 factor (ECF subfamily) [Glycomyces algeriensis]GLI43626.1 RNA polymerase sigma24 factor [Glycomyces algeriensis]
MNAVPDPPAAVFNEHRELLFGIVYGMLGTVADTEDVLQDVWLAWERRSHGAPIEHARAYLVRVGINAAIGRQEAVKRRRETYIGPWLPEPVLTEAAPDAAEPALLTESVSLALMVVLESLTPAERAVFVLADVFGYAHGEVAVLLGRSPASVRQTAHRARSHVQARRPKFAVDPAVHRQVTERFMAAVSGGDIDGLLGLMAPDVVLTCDGGGLGPAAGPRPMRDAERIAALLVSRRFRRHEGLEVAFRPVNGSPAALMWREGRVVGVLMLDLTPELDRVAAVYAVTNPQKLTTLH